MKVSDSEEARPVTGDFDALVSRIHKDLRKERRARAWREGAPERRKTLLTLAIVMIPLVAAFFLSLYI